MFDRFIKTEERTLENPNAPVSSEDFLHIMGWGDFSSAAGITVNVDNALGVPAVWAKDLVTFHASISYRTLNNVFNSVTFNNAASGFFNRENAFVLVDAFTSH